MISVEANKLGPGLGSGVYIFQYSVIIITEQFFQFCQLAEKFLLAKKKTFKKGKERFLELNYIEKLLLYTFIERLRVS